MQPTRGSRTRIMVCVTHRFWQRGVELCAHVGVWETATRADHAMMSLTTAACTLVKRITLTSGARACHLTTISLRAKSVQTEYRQGASLSAPALCSDSINQRISRPVELGQLALPGGGRSPFNAEKAPELSPSRRPRNPYNPRTRENSYARGGRRQNRQNLQKGLLEVLEALASGKSSRILIGETSVHAVANRAQRRARMPIWCHSQGVHDDSGRTGPHGRDESSRCFDPLHLPATFDDRTGFVQS
jgi:hypothetical protein